MNPELEYIKFLLKINKGDTQFNISCDKARYVLLINECKNRWVEKHIKSKDSILIESLQEIVETVNYDSGIDKDSYIEYELKEDFYESISAQCTAEKNGCKKKLFSREIKNQNKNFFEFDENLKPDFNFEWTFHTIQSNKLKVYKTDFNINKIVFSYYKVLPDFDVEGYTKIDGTLSTNTPLPLSQQYFDQITNLAVEEFMRDFENINGLQIAQNRTNNQE